MRRPPRQSGFCALLVVCLGMPLWANPPVTKERSKASGQEPPAREFSPLERNLADLHSPDVAVRRQAAETLAQNPPLHAVAALIQALADEDAAVRASSARALGSLRSPDASHGLARALETDPAAEVRQAAAVALGLVGDPATFGSLSKALMDKDPAVRLSAAQALGTVRAKSAVPELTAALGDSQPDFRRVCVQSLGEIKDPSAAPALRPFLKDKDLPVKISAVEALGKMKDTFSQPLIKKMLGRRQPAGLRVAAAHALCRMGDTEGRTAALEVLRDVSAGALARLEAVRALWDMRDPSLLEPVRALADAEPEGEVKANALLLAQKLEALKR